MKLKMIIFLGIAMSAKIGAVPPNVVSGPNACWLDSITWNLWNMPELRASLLGSGGDAYLSKQPSTDPKMQKDDAIAQAYTKLFRELEKGGKGGKKEFDEVHGAACAIIGKAVGTMADAQELWKILSAFEYEHLLWVTKITPSLELPYGWELPHIITSAQVRQLIDAFFENQKYDVRNKVIGLEKAKAKQEGRDVAAVLKDLAKKFVDENQLVSMLRAEGMCLFAGQSSYIIAYLPNFVTCMQQVKIDPVNRTIEPVVSIEPHVTAGLRQEMLKKGTSFAYKLIGVIMWEGGAHFTAYVKDQYDPQEPWYACNDLGKPQVVPVDEKYVLGPWAAGRSPRVLFYRRLPDLKKVVSTSAPVRPEDVARLAEALKALAPKQLGQVKQ